MRRDAVGGVAGPPSPPRVVQQRHYRRHHGHRRSASRHSRDVRFGLGRVAGRAGWGIADQAASSLTNSGLGIVVARAVSTREFGVFALVFGAYIVALNAGNALISEPFLIRYSSVPDDKWRREASRATGAALALGLATGTLSFAVSLIIGGSLGRGFAALAPVLPGLLVHDTWRSLFVARRRGHLSFVTDAVWAVAMFPLVVVVSATGHQSAVWFVLAWGGVATGTAALGCVLAGVRPSIGQTTSWLRAQRDLVPRFFAELMVLSGAQQVGMYIIGIVAGLAAVGAIRGAEILLGPIYVIIFGIRLMAVPEAIGQLATSPAAMHRNLIRLATALAVVSLAAGAVILLLPSGLGRALLGASWPAARTAVLGIALFMAATGASMAALVGLRALAAPKRSLRARMVNAMTLVAGGTTGGVAGGSPRSAAFGVGIGMCIGVFFWWWQLELALRDHRSSKSRDVATPPVVQPSVEVGGDAEDITSPGSQPRS